MRECKTSCQCAIPGVPKQFTFFLPFFLKTEISFGVFSTVPFPGSMMILAGKGKMGLHQKSELGPCPKDALRDLPGGSLVKNPPADAGDTDSIPGPGRFHMLQSN